MLLKDRFAVLDPAPGTPLDRSAQGIFTQRSSYDTKYAAMYYPWLKIRDPLYPNQRGGKLCPPGGHVIGVYARVDSERGVFKAPANEVIRSITGLEIKINEREHGQFNIANINVIRDFRDDNRGFRIYGARCLTSDNANKYIPVRRLLIFIEESLQEGLQWVVFEPNAEALWQQVKLTVRGFLRTVWRSGGFLPHAYLAYAVYAFFENGGRECWVARVADPTTARAARLDIPADSRGGTAGLTIWAIDSGAWGDQLAITLEATHLAQTRHVALTGLDSNQLAVERATGFYPGSRVRLMQQGGSGTVSQIAAVTQVNGVTGVLTFDVALAAAFYVQPPAAAVSSQVRCLSPCYGGITGHFLDGRQEPQWTHLVTF